MSKFIGKGTFQPGSLAECALNFTDSVTTGLYESSTGVLNLVASGTSYLQLDTKINAQSVIDMGTNKITNLGTPTVNSDATTKLYVDTAVGGSGLTAGDGIDITTNVISVVGSATILSAPAGVSVNSSSTANQLLLSSGTVGTASTFGAVPLGNSNSVTGTLVVGNGGTGATTFTTNGVLIGNGTSAVGTSSTTLNSAGTLTMTGAFYVNTRTVSSGVAVTVNATDNLLMVNNSASIAVNLPTASTNAGRYLTIVKTGSNILQTITVTPNGADTINGTLASVLLTTQYSRITLECDGVSTWYSI